ncbi:MAG: 2-amino-4-hydroxy-6-hydroxymethyldihydropteridine diphosphokinase [Xanthomonadales bacterium]|nr:2-amino-4-hydroxy-6-hydroxymethyldihydropteridine diphosphokinase [Xanthomonadales bacterium]MCB1634260.1 2-amino-4-hydroxy-6-hydroxymethyldihydropteridine diphosphokinase [Xanthomonadales bacterium]
MTTATTTEPRYLLLLGSNSSPERKLDLAVAGLRRRFEGLQLSQREQSRAREGGDAPDYINQAALIRSELAPAALKLALRELEKDLGRRRPSPDPLLCPIDIDLIAQIEPRPVAFAPEDLADPVARRLCGELIGDLLPVLRGL